jgi:hypothetical protein
VRSGERLKACLRRWLRIEPCPEETPPPCGDTGLAQKVSATERHKAAQAQWGPREWWSFFLLGRRPDPLPSFSGLVEPAEEGKVGIACSGGGIRSASFSLGALQMLQEKGVLKRCRYLSAVSGGSYIAAAFCMVRKTWPEGQAQPPGSDDSDPNVVGDRYPPFFRGSPEEQYLLNRSSYLAPDAKGKAALGLRLLLGLGFNLLVIALFVAIIAILLGALYGILYPSLDQSIAHCKVEEKPCDFSVWPPPPGLWIPIAATAAGGLVLGAAGMVAFRWPGRLRDFAATWSLRLVILAAAAAVLLIAIPLLLSLFRDIGNVTPEGNAPEGTEGSTSKNPKFWSALIGASSFTSALGALFLQLRADWLEAQKLAKKAAGTIKWYTSLNQRLRRGLAYLIAAVVGPVLALAFALVVMSATLNLVEPSRVWLYCGGLAAVFAIFYATADLTTWSLHPFYRRRLASAFALKRVARPPGTPPIAAEDDSSEPKDAGIAVERDYDRLVKLSATGVDRDEQGNCQWPTLLVCAAANVSDSAATPAGRAVSSFTFSPTSIGGPLVGAVKTADLEDSCDPRRQASFTLPAVVAISGAALSPSMGKMTRRPLRLLMGLANVRLGVWVPNPRRLETFRDKKRYPRPRPHYLLREMLGLNQLNLPYLYVTDGGHYENLGALELLRRGCTEIYCFDASQDELEALGDMVSLARSELNVEVEIKPEDLRPEDGISKRDCVEGTIHYPGGIKGRIYYARPAITEKAPADVTIYHRQNPRFPRDPTGDQLYTGQRFEAYRALGLSAGRSAVEAATQPPPSAQPTP